MDRPGYFGARRDKKIAELNETHGEGNWRLVWKYRHKLYPFEVACRYFYERSYYEFLRANPDKVDFICQFGEVIDNADSNIRSGLDYTIQEARSTHIQDIAIRNVLKLLGRDFNKSSAYVLTVRGAETDGGHLNPGQVPFFDDYEIMHPSLAPKWAQKNSVEDFWQSNKYVEIIG